MVRRPPPRSPRAPRRDPRRDPRPLPAALPAMFHAALQVLQRRRSTSISSRVAKAASRRRAARRTTPPLRRCASLWPGAPRRAPRRTPRLAPHLASVAFPAAFHAIHLRHSPPPRSVTLFEQFITDKNDPVWVAWKKHVAYLGPLFKDKCTVTDVVALDAMIHDHQIAFDKVRRN